MPLQVPNLDDRNFAALLAEAKARIPVSTPEWTNFNDSDPGITVVQLFAFLTENLLYRSNRIPEANRQKFLTLLGIPLLPAIPGRGLVAFHNDRGPLQAWPLDAGAEVRAGKVPFRTRTGVCILPLTALAYYKQPQTLDDATQAQYRLLYESFLNKDADQLQYYKTMPLAAPEIGKPLPAIDLGDSQNGTIDRSLWVALAGPPNVPPASVRAAIAGQTLALGIYPAPDCKEQILQPATTTSQAVPDPGLVFEIAAPDPDPTGQFGVGDAHYTRLNVEYAENVLQRPGIVQVTLPDYDRLLLWDQDPEEAGTGAFPPLIDDKSLAGRIVTWIRVRLPQPGDAPANGTTQPPQQARLTWVGANAARVIQAIPVTNERLGVATGTPNQTYKVANMPVITDTSAEPAAGGTPAPTFVLQVQTGPATWETWAQVDDLFAAGANDAVYTLDPEAGLVSFGSGLRGKRPGLGQTIRASYEYGGGLAGKVAIGAINKSPALPGGFTVENPVPTWGADAGEGVADGERNIPRYLQHRDRLVTASDFHDLVLRTPGVDVGRVEILPLFNPDAFDANNAGQTWPGTITVLVIPRYDAQQPDAPLPDRLFLNAVCAWLDPRRLVTTEIYVRGPDYVKLWVSVGIVSLPGQVRELVARNVQAAIRDYLSPLTGGPPIPGAPNNDPCADPASADPCAPPRGVGWPLGQDVRVQDLEAVATRVPGVRYVDSIQLGVLNAGGATLTGVTRAPLVGLQLPRLAGISVHEGPAEDLANLLGQGAATDSLNYVPVPVLPKKC